MCGICGIVERDGASPDSRVLEGMNQRILHRGPDEGGSWIEDRAGLAMRRLAIIDLIGGHQPMFNEDGSVAIVFNGEIYNYQELRPELEAAGHRLATHSDTETIIHLYEQYGVSALARLNGMFAFALWDRRKQQLLLARDRAGKKPLYYTVTSSGQLAFSSELASLLAFPGISRDIDAAALDDYFALGYIPSPQSVFRQIHKLPPGSCLIWKDGALKVERYWRLPVPVHEQGGPVADEDEVADRLLQLLRDAVKIRLYSDVPFGALLSGGVDSSLVVGLMSELMSKPVETFNIGFEDKRLDESVYAAEIAKLFQTNHHTLIVQPPAVAELLGKLIVHFGEPFADASAIPTFLVSQLARQHVTMVLSGDGGDEVFGGYPSYRYHAWIDSYNRTPGALRGAAEFLVEPLVVGGRPGTNRGRLGRFLREARLPVDERWIHSRSLFTDVELDQLYTPEFRAALNPGARASRLRDSFAHCRNGHDCSTINYADYENYMTDDVLVKVDRMSMASSLEVRSPLLDYRVAELAATLPRSLKWTGKESKRILKKCAARMLPAEILARRKQGFVLPIRAWFQNELVPLFDELLVEAGHSSVVQPEYCRMLLEQHRRTPYAGIERKLWSILCYLYWRRTFGSIR
jgi:asparagine synthase (glutamine-hydrolysing)